MRGFPGSWLRVAVLAALTAAVVWPAAAPTAAGGLAGSQWRIVEIEGQTARHEETAEFTADKISGKAACNRYFGGATLDGTKLRIGAIGATRMFCADRMEAEQRLFAALGKVAQVAREDAGQRLRLIDAEGRVLVLLAPK